MSDEIVVGACYRDVRDGEIVRVLGPEQRLLGLFPAVVLKAGESAGHGGQAGARVWRDRDALTERVPDPTPAIAEDAESPLAGELTARQFFTWAATQDADRAPRVHISCTGGVWTATLTVCPPGQDRVTQRSASARDPQDALTALMSEER